MLTQIQRRYIIWNAFWNNVKWMKKRTRAGRPNQKCWSPSWTTGIPWTTTCLSLISRAIVVMIAWSFVPTASMICICSYVEYEEIDRLKRNKWTNINNFLTNRGIIETHTIVPHPLTLRSKKMTADAHNTGLHTQIDWVIRSRIRTCM